MALIETLAPQMIAYSKQFHTDGDVEWMPYLMFFHPRNYQSDVVNTDEYGFRISEWENRRLSVASGSQLKSANLIAGNSVVFGIGASSDTATLASRMMRHEPKRGPWLNFGGRAFNSAQELILLTLFRHLLPKINEIILFSGFNNLCLARLPENQIQDHGAFYNCGRFFDAFQETHSESNFSLSQFFGAAKKITRPENQRTLEERINFAASLTLRHLDGWYALAQDLGARLTFILQPTSGWVRETGSTEEQRLFAEIDKSPRYTTVQKDVLQQQVCEQYASLLRAGAERKGVSFVNMSPCLSAATQPDQWLFIDPAHMTDGGYDLTSRLILESTR